MSSHQVAPVRILLIGFGRMGVSPSVYFVGVAYASTN